MKFVRELREESGREHPLWVYTLIFPTLLILCSVIVGGIWLASVNNRSHQRLRKEVALFRDTATFQSWDDISVTRNEGMGNVPEARAVEALFGLEERFPFLSATDKDSCSKRARELIVRLRDETLDPSSHNSFTEGEMKDVEQIVAEHADAINFLKKIGTFPPSDAASIRKSMSYNPNSPLAFRLPNLVTMQTAQSFLLINAISKFDEGEGGDGIDSLFAALRLSNHALDIPSLISWLSGAAMQKNALAILKRSAGAGFLTPEDCRAYLAYAPTLHRRELLGLAMEADRLLMIEEFMVGAELGRYDLWYRFPLFAFWPNQDLTAYYAIMREAIGHLDAPCGEAIEQLRALDDRARVYKANDLRYPLSSIGPPALEKISILGCELSLSIQLSIVAVEATLTDN